MELLLKAFAEFRQRDQGQCRRVGSHHASAAAIGHQGQSLIVIAAESCERFRSHEQILKGVHAQHARPADRGIEDDVGAGKRATVGCGGLHTLACPPGLDDDHRFVARGGTSGRHELARVLD